jgi:hypothetical protein
MKTAYLLIFCSLQAIPCLGFVDDFNNNYLDPGFWEIMNTDDSAKSEIEEIDGKLNFLFTDLNPDEYGFAGIQSLNNVSNIHDFTISFEVEHTLQNQGFSYLPGLGLAIVPANGSGLLILELMGTDKFRLYLDDGKNGGEYFAVDTGMSGGGTSYFYLNYDSVDQLFHWTVREQDAELFSDTVGISTTPGSLGVIDLSMGIGDEFSIILHSHSQGINSTAGDLTIDNFSLSIVPENKSTPLFMGILFLCFTLFRGKTRTSRWW